ncbi:VanZ family protein [Actinomycetes bacterium KLBMP 9797]
MFDEVIADAGQVIGSGLPAAALLAGLAGALLGYQRLAGLTGWPRWATLGLLASVVPIVALTAVPTGPLVPGSAAAERLRGFFDAVRYLPWPDLRELGSYAEGRANVALFVPAAFFLTVACRRAWPAVLLGPALSLTIECGQAFDAWRSLDPMDLVHNSVGAWLGALAGIAVLLVRFGAGLVYDHRHAQ